MSELTNYLICGCPVNPEPGSPVRVHYEHTAEVMKFWENLKPVTVDRFDDSVRLAGVAYLAALRKRFLQIA